jgi:ribosomal protein S18 acetylase RimI-like enzyme
MKMHEVVLYPSRDVDLSNYQHNFDLTSATFAFNGLRFVENKTDQSHDLGLFDKDTLVAYLRLDIRDHGLWQITLAQTDPKFQGQGCFRYLLLKAVEDHNNILSDDHQTQQAADAWKSLIRYPSNRIKILLYDFESKKTIPISDVLDSEIWNQKENLVLMITKQKYIKESIRDTEIKKRYGRDYDSIWFGPNSSNDDYINP